MNPLLVIVVALLGLFAISKANAQSDTPLLDADGNPVTDSDGNPVYVENTPTSSGQGIAPPSDDSDFTSSAIMTSSPTPDQAAANRAAMRAVIRHSEGTDQLGDPYAALFGDKPGMPGSNTYGYSNHPANLGWRGVQYTNQGKTWLATAAGAYQILKGTWNALGLPDFTPANQDAACDMLIEQKGAMPDVEAGNFSAAVAALGSVWASLPSSTAGQPTRSLDSLAAVFASAGGIDAGSSGGEAVSAPDVPSSAQIDLAMGTTSDDNGGDDSGDDSDG